MPYRLSEQWLPVDAEGIRQLIVRYPISRDHWLDARFPAIKDMLQTMPRLFPKLEKLRVVLKNNPTLTDDRWDELFPEDVLSRKAERTKKMGELIDVVKRMELKKRMKHVNPTKSVAVEHRKRSEGTLSVDFELKDKHVEAGEEKAYTLDELTDFSLVEIS